MTKFNRSWFLLGIACLVIIVVVLKLNSSNSRDTPPLDKRAKTNSSESPTAGHATSLFQELSPDESGVTFVHRLAANHPKAYLYHSGYTCGGVCLGDMDGDGRTDIFLVSGPDDNALFINQGNLRFEKSPASVLLGGGEAWGVGASIADVDGDGDLDIFVCNYDSPNRLWLNQGRDKNGQLQFTECSSIAGLNFAGPSQCPYFADFDLDGDLDLFLLTNRLYSPFGRPREVASELGPDGKPRIKEKYSRYFRVVDPQREVPSRNVKAPGPFMLEYGHPDRLLRNEGPDKNGVPLFTDMTAKSGLDNVPGHGLSALVWDINHDHRPDIYVANDYTDPDRLWINQGMDDNGVVRFVDATDQFVPYTSWSSMGSDVADVNGDGQLDFMVADMAATSHFKAKTTMGEMTGWRRWVLEHGWPRQSMRNMLFVDSGGQRFREVGFIAGVASSDWTWAVKFADLDLDGRNDLLLTNGSARVFTDSDIIVRPSMMVGQTEWEIFRDKPELHEENIALRNVDGKHFQDASRRWNLDKKGMSYGAATGDLDGDGDLDVVICNLNDNVSIYRNHATESGFNWLRIQLQEASNRFAFGAVVKATFPDGTSQIRLMNPQTGFLSGNEPVLHFGLGDRTQIQNLQVRWSNGTVQELGPVKANQLLVVRQSEDAKYQPAQRKPTPRFREIAKEIGLDYRHTENHFSDFDREFLLPGKLSRFGPCIAVGDINGDQLDDVFVGGAANQSAVLFVNSRNQGFRRVEKMPWNVDMASEDMGALFFDADRDGDLDLYVAHGSNEWAAGDDRYRDTLFLNETESGRPVQFVNAPDDALPVLANSGCCVVGSDFDNDGDIDLFVGSRSIPGKYPLTPNSTILRNEGTRKGEVRFRDVTHEISPGLENAGLVTAALWSDANDDGWTDLFVTCEWGPVRLYVNHQGKLVESTDAAGLHQKLGWWNAITGSDFDGDGDMDYVVCNVGANTKYGHASAKKPALLYRGDMDQNGVFDLVEAKASPEGELPVRGRSCSCLAMPELRKRFPTYKGFATANLSGIYTDQRLANSTKLMATEFESGLWINESSKSRPNFKWQKLPYEAQISPCFGVVAVDLFGDGAPSLAMAQNLFSREPETGVWRGGLGCVFQPQPSNKGSLMFVETNHSGFSISGDGKGLAVTDFDADGRPDLLASQNDDVLLAFQQPIETQQHQSIAVRLKGPPGNPNGLGAKIRLFVDGERRGLIEVYGGSGYLSQSSSLAFFRRPTKPARIDVTWPGGKRNSVRLTSAAANATLLITAP